MNNALRITVEAAPGSSIESACREAEALAEKLGLTVLFNFNGVKVLARAGDSQDRIVQSWEAEVKSKQQYKIASDRGPTPAPQGDQS